jgi:hypothetical protein
VISLSLVESVMGDQDWEFGEGPTADAVNSKRRLGEIYLLVDPRLCGKGFGA